ncbi:MAG: response regulator, partial [Chloroflexota bacterium]|nr:response regulator [Chloroflexota bacterium]
MVLVIDDEEMILESIQDILAMINVPTLCAVNGQVGIEIFQAQQGQIRVILLDMLMPVMGGPETLRKIRELDPEIQVILSSGFSESDTRAHLHDNHAVIFLQKPYALETLLNKVQTALA